MAGHVQQAELPLVKPRIKLLELEPDEELPVRPRRASPDPVAQMRAMARASEAQLAALTERGQEVGQAVIDGQLRVISPDQIEARQGWPANENPQLYTAWETQAAPTWDGFYDITDSRTGTLNERWWFQGSSGPMMWFKDWQDRGSDLTPTRNAVMHDEFVERGLAWRGLREEPRDPYPVPPYWPPLLPPKVALDGKHIKRTRAE